MICPFCNSDTKVYNSRSSHQSTQTWRRRKCLNCHKAFTTREKVDYTGLIIVRSAESETPYSREKLLLSIVKAGDNLKLPPEIFSELTDSVELQLQKQAFFGADSQESQTIVSVTLEVLTRYDKNLAMQYVNVVYANQPPHRLLKQILELSS